MIMQTTPPQVRERSYLCKGKLLKLCKKLPSVTLPLNQVSVLKAIEGSKNCCKVEIFLVDSVHRKENKKALVILREWNQMFHQQFE